MTVPLLECDNIRFTYAGNERPALNGLSLQIHAGRKTVLLGHNGCGKSTFFLHANGIYRPNGGEMRWKGKPFTYTKRALLELRQHIGIVFQDPEQQVVASTVAEDISYGLCNRKLPKDEVLRRVEEAMEKFSLQELSSQPVHQLSLGQKKRLALAGVMVLAPELLLLDEPTAYLDRLHIRKLLAELESIHQEGTTIVMATHDMNLALEWGDWIMIMHRGRLVLEGKPDDVFRRRRAMEELGLELPTLCQIWDALPGRYTAGVDKMPRTVDELRTLMNAKE